MILYYIIAKGKDINDKNTKYFLSYDPSEHSKLWSFNCPYIFNLENAQKEINRMKKYNYYYDENNLIDINTVEIKKVDFYDL